MALVIHKMYQKREILLHLARFPPAASDRRGSFQSQCFRVVHRVGK